MKKMKKFLCCFLIMVLVLGASFSSKASAVGELAIVGDMLMSMELLGDIGFIIGDSLGISGAITEASNIAGVTERDYLMSFYRAFASTQIGQQFGLTSSVLQLAAQGIRYTSSGIFTLSAGISDYFKDFFDWAWSEEGANLQQYAEPDLSGQIMVDYSGDYGEYSGDLIVQINTASIVLQGNPSNFTFDATGNSPVYICFYSTSDFGTVNVYACSAESFSLRKSYSGGGQTNNSSAISNYPGFYCTYVIGRLSGSSSTAALLLSSEPSRSVITPYVTAYYDTLGKMILGGSIDGSDPAIDVSGLELAEGQVAAINPVDSFTWGNHAGTVNVDDYIGGVVEGIKTGTADIPYTDEQDQPGTITVEQTGQLELTQDSTADWPDTLPLSPETSTDSLDPFVIDLREFFPFCIPFDVYDLLLLLRAERAAPDVTWRFYAPGIVDYSLELDFSVLDPVATVLRTMELLAFAVGLALATKSMIQGGD